MSYCTCFVCGNIVSMYEKCCPKCVDKHDLKQGDWRSFKPETKNGTPERQTEILEEIKRDKFDGKRIEPVDLQKVRKERKERKRRVKERRSKR